MTVFDRLSRLSPGLLKVLRTACALATLGALIAFGTIGYNTDPVYYWLMLTALVPMAAYGPIRRLAQRADARIRARGRWKRKGGSVDRITYTILEKLQDRYAELTHDATRGPVDDRTWRDLGMDEVQGEIDVCFTIAGRNELGRILRHALPGADETADRLTLAERIREDSAAREALAVPLASVGEERDADPADLLWGDAPRTDDLLPLFITMCALAVLVIPLAAFVDLTAGLVGAVVVFFTNMWIYYRKARHVSIAVPALRVLSRMMHATDEFVRGPLAAEDAIVARLAEPRKATSGARRAFRALLTGAPNPAPTLTGDLMEALYLYVKIYFLVDLLAYNRIVALLIREREQFRMLYQTLGTIDATYALASYRSLRRRTCDATLLSGGGDAPLITIEGALHPLIPKAVGNDVSFSRPGAVITGTNMAGKSTFLRTVGINVLFAQTAGFAFADSYRATRFLLVSSIEKHDDLAAGKSFYYDEAERIYRMIEGVTDEVPALLLIDELLSGTNSLERESASIAILHYLADRNAVTLAATHDVTIARGVGDRYALYYFTDSADETGLSFDYKIQPGVVQTRNAIKLLRLIGYPHDVIQAALEATGGEA